MQSRFPLVPLLGALLHLTRGDAGNAAAQRALLSAIRAQLKSRPLVIAAEGEFLLIDGETVPLDVPGATLINEQLLLHGVGVLEIPAAAEARDLIRLATVLGGFPRAESGLDATLAALGDSAGRFKLGPASLELELRAMAGRGDHAAAGHADLGLTVERSDADSIAIALPGPEGDAERLTGGTVAPARPPLEAIVDQARQAIARRDWNALLDAGLQLIQEEDESPSPRQADLYRQELTRLVRPELLSAIAGFACGERRQEAIGLLRHFGAAATETLVALLIEAATMGERRGYYSAITQMAEGAETIISRLDHPLWYVVRNAAELCGDMELAGAVPALGRQVHHPDDRVRKSVASSLARIATPSALQTLRRMLHDPAIPVRRHALLPLGGVRARELCASIAALLELERELEVQREALFALGRIGTGEAIQVLDGWARLDPEGTEHRPLALRLLALNALTLAGPAATGSLSRLTRDVTPEVRSAAKGALAALAP